MASGRVLRGAVRRTKERIQRLASIALFVSIAITGTVAAERARQTSPGDWMQGWNGLHGAPVPDADVRTPDAEQAFRFTWNRSSGSSLPNMAHVEPTHRLSGDVAVFWIRTDRPLARLQVIFTDQEDVGAEQSVPSLLYTQSVAADIWHFVVWPFRTHPGWVRYKRSQMDWDHVKAISFYTWPEQIPSAVTVDVGPLRTMTYAELEELFLRHPERAHGNRSVPWRVMTGERPDRMMPRYYQSRFEAKSAALHRKYPPELLAKSAHSVRAALGKAFMMPPRDPVPTATHVRTVTIDDVQTDLELLALAPGVASPALVFRPKPAADSDPGQRFPAVLMLPGHGDPSWSPSVQSRCLSFARAGYLVLLVQPFGQAERGENPRWNEGHDSQATAFLLTAGQSLLGLIMADHRAELGYLCARPDVDPKRICLTGVSMGGTHTLWLAAYDTRISAAVAVAAGMLYLPGVAFRHQGLCDLIVGAFDVADMAMLQALCAPRPLLRLFPGSERPLTDEGYRLFLEGWMEYEETLKKHSRTDAQIRELHAYEHAAYAAAGAPGAYRDLVVEGVHDYTQAMREAAAGWLQKHLRAAPNATPVPEPALKPVKDRAQAVARLSFWPDGERPPEILSPTAYVQREIRGLADRLPKPPADAAAWSALRKQLRTGIASLLGVSLAPAPAPAAQQVGQARAADAVLYKLTVQPEPGITLPMLLFEPEHAAPDARLTVLLSPEGMTHTAASPERTNITKSGEWALCVDLRGMGETHYDQESGGYMGFRDYDIALSALKLGETLAGYWTRDLLTAIAAARKKIGSPLHITVRGDREAGLIAVLAAGQSDTIHGVVATGLLSSCYSPSGYGLPYAYSDENNSKSVSQRPLGGYGSMVPCIPSLMRVADIAQLAALVAPRPLTIVAPRTADGRLQNAEDAEQAFAWTRAAYRAGGASELLLVKQTPP